MRRIAFAELQARIERVLLALGVAPARCGAGCAADGRDGSRRRADAWRGAAAAVCAACAQRADRSACGAEKVAGFGAIERWTGRRGPGNLAAYAAMQRAMEIGARAWAGVRGAGGYVALDACGNVWMAGGRCGICGDVLDEYAAESAAVGREHGGAGE